MTVIIMESRAEPAMLLATRVYEVVVAGETVLVPLADTVPIPGVMVTELAPVTFHCILACSPDRIDEVFDLKDVITGTVNNLEISP